MSLLALAVSLTVSTAASPSGERLHAGRTCYAITSPAPDGSERVLGATLQVLTREVQAGRPVWRIVVHQRLTGGRFDMRDEMVLDAHSLVPLSLDTVRGGKPHALLAFSPGHVTGLKWDAAGRSSPIDTKVPDPVWEGDLFGPTFASLPLVAGARFTVPFYQYDKGVGAFTVAVTGSRMVSTPQGRVDAWVLDAGPDPTSRLEFLIAKMDGQELGYSLPQGGQRLGGDCTGLT